MATHSSILKTEEPAWWATVQGVTKSRIQLNTAHTSTQDAYIFLEQLPVFYKN